MANWLLLLALFTAPQSALASEAMAAEESATAQPDASATVPHPASDCPALFGTATQQKQNTDTRQERLLSVEKVAQSQVVSHAFSRWTSPRVFHVPGLNLVSVKSPKGDHPAELTLRVEDAWAAQCEPGLYTLSVDDSVGADGQILATTTNSVLIQNQGALFAWSPEGHRPQENWRMVWRAGYEITIEQGGHSKASKKKRSKKKQRKKKHKRPRKKRGRKR